jgi:hypothetical protein
MTYVNIALFAQKQISNRTFLVTSFNSKRLPMPTLTGQSSTR